MTNGSADYINCRCRRTSTIRFTMRCWPRLVEEKDWEKLNYFESCLPIEEIAPRGPRHAAPRPHEASRTERSRTGKIPYAAVQLRQEKPASRLLNLRRLPEPPEIREQAACCASYPPGKCPLPALRTDPPHHLHQHTHAAHSDSPDKRHPTFCSPTNLRSRRLRRIHVATA